MSRAVERVDLDSLGLAICEFCGEAIVDSDQNCPARDDGRCAP